MDFQRFKEFITLAECAEFQSASEKCGIHKSALTRHIQAMEEELNVPLFERNSHKVELTIAGRRFLPYAYQLINLNNACHLALNNNSNDSPCLYKIKANTGAMAPYFNLISQDERVSLFITVENSENVISELRKNEIDIAIIRNLDNINRSDLVTITFNSIEFAAVLPVSHPLANRKHLALSDLADEQFIILHSNQNFLMAACSEAGFIPSVKNIGSEAEFILNRVSANQGVSIMLRKSTEHRNREHNYVVIPFDPPLSGKDQIVYLKSKDSEELKEFTDYLFNIITKNII